jgi:hypothetical protein
LDPLAQESKFQHCDNEIGREWKKYLEHNDAHTLLEYLKNKWAEDLGFFMQLKYIRKMAR